MRRASYAVRAEGHRTQGSYYEALAERRARDGRRIDAARYQAIAAYHGRLTARYTYAASHPWLPVAPDASEPE